MERDDSTPKKGRKEADGQKETTKRGVLVIFQNEIDHVDVVLDTSDAEWRLFLTVHERELSDISVEDLTNLVELEILDSSMQNRVTANAKKHALDGLEGTIAPILAILKIGQNVLEIKG